MTTFKNDPTEENDLKGDFIPQGLSACLDYYKNYDDCTFLENEIDDTDAKIIKAMDDLQFLIEVSRTGHNDFMANKLSSIKENLRR